MNSEEVPACTGTTEAQKKAGRDYVGPGNIK